jgi:hypothetical protein
MALILLEGLDRTGKSTVAAYYESLGYDLVHLSAPPKGTSSDDYMQQMLDLVSSAAYRDLVLDRTAYGEYVWPEIYGRQPLLSEDQLDALAEVEDTVGVTRIIMYDSDLEAHWKRCVDNKEPLTKPQFSRARGLYSQMARKYNFEMVTLPKFLEKFPDAKDFAQMESKTVVVQGSGDNTTTTEVDLNGSPNDSTQAKYPQSNKTPEQIKLERANVINDILSKRILKSKGLVYDELENDIRDFLNSKLGKLLGGNSKDTSLSAEEVKFFKALYKNALNNNKGV